MKNRRNFAIALIIVVVLATVIALSACDVITSDKYTIESVYAEAKSLGYSGTLPEFIALVSGKDGVDGRGIESITSSKSGLVTTYTITYSDGDTYEFQVKDGVDGATTQIGYSNYQLWLQMNDKTSDDEGYSLEDYFNYVKSGSSQIGSSDEESVTYAIGSTLAVVSEYIENGSTLVGRAGSGIIYKDTGTELYLITNFHVVYFDKTTTQTSGMFGTSITRERILSALASKVRVYFYGMQYSSASGYGIEANIVGGSYENDVAVLSLEGESYTKYKEYVAKCGKLSDGTTDFIRPVTEYGEVAAVGAKAIAIGNPEGEGLSVSSGVVSVESEYIDIDIYCNSQGVYTSSNLRVMRIDTAVNSGNSGGGLFNENGEWIGIVNAKIASTDIENISYAIPHEIASGLADNIIYYYDAQRSDSDATNDDDYVHAKRLVLGVTIQKTDSYAQVINGKVTTVCDLEVYSIEKNSVASSLAGTANEIKVGDVLLYATIGGKEITLDNLYKLREDFIDIHSGTTFTLTVKRNGETKTLTVTVAEKDLKTVN